MSHFPFFLVFLTACCVNLGVSTWTGALSNDLSHALLPGKAEKFGEKVLRTVLRLRGGSEPDVQDKNMQIPGTGDDSHDENVVKKMGKLTMSSGGEPTPSREEVFRDLEARVSMESQTVGAASRHIADVSEGILSELDEGRSSQSDEEEKEKSEPIDIEELPSYAPPAEDMTIDQAQIFRKYRVQLDQAMKDFEVEPLDEENYDPELQRQLAEERAELEEMAQFAQNLNQTFTEAAKLWGGDGGNQLEPPDHGELHPVIVDKADPDAFQTVSAAVNASVRGQTVAIAPGQHEVGDALCWMGMDDQCVPQHYPDTLHIPDTWHLNVEGEDGAAVDGKWWMGEETEGRMERVMLSFHATVEDSLTWVRYGRDGEQEPEPDFDNWREPDEPEEASSEEEPPAEADDDNEEEAGEGAERDLAGEVLVEMLGAWAMSECSLKLNGGQVVQLQGSASLELRTCELGGLGPANHSLQEAELTAEAVMALQRCLGSDAEPRAAAGVLALNASRLTAHACRIAHVWNGGVSLHQRSTGQVSACGFVDVGFAVGVDDRASAAVQRCTVELGTAGLLDTGAFYAAESSAEAAMHLSHNQVQGRLWLGGRRPGRRLVERGNSGDGPDEFDDGVTVEEGRVWEEVGKARAEMAELHQKVRKSLREVRDTVANLSPSAR